MDANDLSLFDIAGYAVGFCPVERVKERSDEVLENTRPVIDAELV